MRVQQLVDTLGKLNIMHNTLHDKLVITSKVH